MKKTILLITLLMPLCAFLSYSLIEYKMYSWQKPNHKVTKKLRATTLFEGSAFDMEYMHMSANAVMHSKKPIAMTVAENEEELLLVKTGTLTLQVKDSTWNLVGGSIALLLPTEKFLLQNKSKESCTFYILKYRSKLPIDIARGKNSGGSIVRDWNKITFQPHDKGGIRKYFERPTAMCKRFEMHVTTLKEGIKSHEPHTHRAEEIVLVIDNKTEMQIGEKFYKGAEGDIYYLGSNAPHAIRNDGTGTCTYFAFQFE